MSKMKESKVKIEAPSPSIQKIFVSHVQDIGRENNKSATLFLWKDEKGSKAYKLIYTQDRSRYAVVSDSFKENVPVYRITETKNDGKKITTNIVVGKHAYEHQVDNVLKCVSLDGDERVIENIPIFSICDIVKNMLAFESKKGSGNAAINHYVFNLSIALTAKMRSLPIADITKHDMLTSKYEVQYYPNGLKLDFKQIKRPITFNYDSKKTLKENNAISYNIQGSQTLLSHVYKDDGSFIPQLFSGNFVEKTDDNDQEIYSCKDIICKYINGKMNDDAIAVDLSSREATISLIHKGQVKFENSITIRKGSSDVFAALKDLISIIAPSKRLELSHIKEMYLNNETIYKEHQNLLGVDSVPALVEKDKFTMADLFEIAFDKVVDNIYDDFRNAYKDLRSRVTVNPKFIILGGGGMYDNHGKQTPYITKLINRFIVEFIDRSVEETPMKMYKYIAPHGLYPSNYLFTAKDNPHALCAHVIGLCRSTLMANL